MLAPQSRGFVVLLGALTAITAMSVDMSLPAMPQLTAVFHTTPERTQLTLSVFLFGFAIGQLVYGPISDRFGRRPLLLVGLCLYTLGGVGCALSGSIEQLVAFRFLQGIGGCVGRVMAPAIVRDEFTPQRGAQILSYIILVVSLAPLIAPMIGGYLLVIADWRAIFLVLTAMGAVMLAVTATQLRESIKLRDHSATRFATLLRNYAAFLSHRTCLGHLLVSCCAFAGLFSYISGSSFVFIEVFGVPSALYGVLFGVTALAFMAGASVNSRLLRSRPARRLLRIGLVVLLAGGGAMALCAVLRLGGVLGIMAPMMIYAFGMALVMPNATAAAMEPLPRMAGLASSLLGSAQFAAGSLAGYLVNALYDHTARAMAGGIGLAALSAVLVYLAILRPLRAA